jgi:hypothetical protein
VIKYAKDLADHLHLLKIKNKMNRKTAKTELLNINKILLNDQNKLIMVN